MNWHTSDANVNIADHLKISKRTVFTPLFFACLKSFTISKKFLSTYSASKAAIRDIVLCYKRENSRLGPTISLFSPKPMPTKLRRKFFPGESEIKLFSCLSQAKALRKLI